MESRSYLTISTSIFLTVCACTCLAAKPQCGLVEVKGIVRKTEKGLHLVTNERSKSATTFRVDDDLSRALYLQVDKTVTVKAKLHKPVKGYVGELISTRSAKIQKNSRMEGISAQFNRDDVEARVPNPLDSSSEYWKVTKPAKCRN